MKLCSPVLGLSLSRNAALSVEASTTSYDARWKFGEHERNDNPESASLL